MKNFLLKHLHSLIFMGLTVIFAIVFFSIGSKFRAWQVAAPYYVCVVFCMILLWCLYGSFDSFLFTDRFGKRVLRKLLLLIGISCAIIVSIGYIFITMTLSDSAVFQTLSVWSKGLIYCWSPCFILLLLVMMRIASVRVKNIVWAYQNSLKAETSEQAAVLQSKYYKKYNLFTLLNLIMPFVVIAVSYFIGVSIAAVGLKLEKEFRVLMPIAIDVILIIVVCRYIRKEGLPYINSKVKSNGYWTDAAQSYEYCEKLKGNSVSAEAADGTPKREHETMSLWHPFSSNLEEAIRNICNDKYRILPDEDLEWVGVPRITVLPGDITISGTLSYCPRITGDIDEYLLGKLEQRANEYAEKTEENIRAATEKTIEELKSKYDNYDYNYSINVNIRYELNVR